MAEEERNENTEETAEEQPQAEEKPVQAEEPQAEFTGQAEAEAADEQPEGEEAAADDDAGDDADAEAPAEADQELEGLDWKARRRLERSRQRAEPVPQRSPTERATERAQRRAAARKARSAYRRKRREGGEGAGTPPADRRSVARKMRQGRVVSDKADKTITVRIDVAHRHPTYEKIIRSSNTLRAHDERNEAGEGDLVRVVETRPISRRKRWRLVEVLEKAK